MRETNQNNRFTLTTGIAWVTDACILQLIITGASLPFLIYWNMPFPLLSIVGNIIHPIFLTLFLIVSSTLFFATLLHIPTTLLCAALQIITDYWDALLRLPIPSGWIPLRWWHLIPLYLCGALFYLWKTKCIRSRAMPLTSGVLFLTTILSIYCAPRTGVTVLHRHTQSLICLPHPGNTLEIIDDGYISSASNIPALVNYELMPHILTCYGKPTQLILKGSGMRCTHARKLLQLL
jgi:hypothetical protein